MNNQVLGTIAMICAPVLLVESLLLGGEENAAITGVAGMVFMAGWICSNTAMRRMMAAGTGRWGQAVLLVQFIGLVLAFLFGLFEATGLLEGTIVFTVTDAAWPLSMLWMLVVGIAVIRARRLSGWKRYVPVLCPFWLLVAIGSSAALGGEAGYYFGAGYAAVTWALLGLVVYGAERDRVAATPELAVR